MYKNQVFQIDDFENEIMEQKKIKDMEEDLFMVRSLIDTLIAKHQKNNELIQILHGSYEADRGKTFADLKKKDAYLSNRQFERFNR